MQLRFIISSTLGKVELQDQPQGWDDIKKTLHRNPTYIGVFRKYTAELKFVGDGLLHLNDIRTSLGSEGQFTCTILRKKDYEDKWATEFQGIGKLNPFEVQFEGTSASVAIQLEDSGFHSKFENLAKTEIDTGRTTSLGGVDMGAFPTKTIQLHQRLLQENNVFELGSVTQYNQEGADDFTPAPYGHTVPFEKVSGDTDFVDTPISFDIEAPGLICGFVQTKTAFRISYRITCNGAFLSHSGSGSMTWVVRKFTGDLSTSTDTTLHAITSDEGQTELYDIDISDTIEVTLDANQAFTILLVFVGGEGTFDVQPQYTTTYTTANLTVELIQFFDEFQTMCHYRHEYMKRLVQLITDQADCFKSSVFGRTDIGYPSTGKYSNNTVMSGLQIRGFEDRFPATSFEKAFTSVRSIWNLGCGIEKINNAFKVVIEELPYFFRGDVSVTLHNVSDISVNKAAKDFTFSEVKYGYEKSEYEEVNGLEEYNNKCTAATSIKSMANSLNIVSDERADGYGIEFARRLSVKIAGTEDSKYDDDIFTVMVKAEGGLLRPEKGENYAAVQNIAHPESAYNLDITPQRNLLRNGDWISGCVSDYPDDYVRHCTEDKRTDLSSTRTGESAVTEQTDFQNKTLMSSLWKNQLYSFKCALSPSDIDKIETSPYSLVKWSPFSREKTRKYYYGWVLKVEGGGDDRLGTVQLLAANLSSDRLHLIDPEGIHQGDQGSDLPPQDGEEFGFEYVFESLMEG